MTQENSFQRIFLTLASLNVVASILVLSLTSYSSSIFASSVDINKVWADRIAQIAGLNQLVTELNGPGNDVFETRRIADESKRYEDLYVRAMSRFAEVRSKLRESFEGESEDRFVKALDLAKTATEGQALEARAVFKSLGASNEAEAGGHMARMDQQYSQITDALAGLQNKLLSVQEEHFKAQAATARSIRWFEVILILLTLGIVGSMTNYGLRIVRSLQNGATDRQRLLQNLQSALDDAGSSQQAQKAALAEANAARAETTRLLETLEDRVQDTRIASDTTAARIETSVSALEQLTQSIHEIASNSARSAQAASEVTQAVKASSALFEVLKSRSERINEVTRVITGIAQQTNLLALNASIEAARAGSEGRGFAVVAAEVKQLSKESESSTRAISQALSEIESLISESSQSMGAISNAVANIAEMQHTIASAVEEHAVTTSELKNSSRQIYNSVQDLSSRFAAFT